MNSNKLSNINYSNYYKTIVCDIDDTISFTNNRDWENARPNIELIDRLNRLYDFGWQVIFLTARGTLSCGGDRKLADETYRPQIEFWLNKNGVKYNALLFEKPLAAYYIDDKSITPEDFLKEDIEIIQGGLNNINLERRNDKVYKTALNTKRVVKWYDIARDFFNIPKINFVISDTICMEFIKQDSDVKFDEIVRLFAIMKVIPNKVDFSFETYIDHLFKNHLSDNLYNYISEDNIKLLSVKLKDLIFFMDSEQSFCHGDFSLDNILKKDDKVYLIDPNYYEDQYNGWLLDVSKFVQSCFRMEREQLAEAILNYHDQYSDKILLLELTHWIRMIKYIPTSNVELINKTKNRIKKLEILCLSE